MGTTKGMISVIIPVYNMEKYLERCVSSVIGQTYPHLEILLVDDGSTDSSADLCNKLAAEDSRIRVLTKENGGQGSARNWGIEQACGEYIGFVDSDDWIHPDMYRILLENLCQYDADISACRTIRVKDAVQANDNTDDSVRTFDNQTAMLHHLELDGGMGQCPVDKLYRRKLFDGIRFLELRGYEDAGTIFKLIAASNRVVYQNSALYYYFMRENSTMTRPFSEKDMDRVRAYHEMVWTLREDGRYDALLPMAIRMYLGAIFYVAGEMYRLTTASRREVRHFLTDEIGGIRQDALPLTLKQKWLLRMLKQVPEAYTLLYRYTRRHNDNR